MTLAEVKKTLDKKIGEIVHTSDWLEITQARIERFAEATNDYQWIHVDPERATAESPYGAAIAHGFLSLSLLSYLRGYVGEDQPPFPGVKNIINYGSNRVRFPNAVRVGARIRGRFELQAVEEVKGNGLQLCELATVEIEGEDKPACVAETLMRVYF